MINNIMIAEAIENPVQIVLRIGKSFNAGVLDVEDNGEGLFIVRIPSMRREVLRYGPNSRDILEVTLPKKGEKIMA